MTSTILYEMARANLWKAQERFQYFPDLNMVINDECAFSWKSPECHFESLVSEPYLLCWLKPEMIVRILNHEAHWNNAEIGCHIIFDRQPNTYLPDVHTLMSFFHA